MKRAASYGVLAVLCISWLTSCTSMVHTVPTTNAVIAILETSGTGQRQTVNGMFGAALVATVMTGGVPTPGVTVTFTAPAKGPSATFSDTSSRSASTMTDANGIATSPSITANGSIGTYTISATADGGAGSASFTLTNITGAPVGINATSGSSQSAAIHTAFAAPLVATVVDSGQNPVSGVIVTFTAPSSGPSGTFANGTASETDTTNASGMAVSSKLTANGVSGTLVVTATAAGISTPADFTLTNTAGAATTISVASGSPQSAAIHTAFSSPLVALVVDSNSNPVSGAWVTFTAPSSGPTGTFSNGTATEVDTTDANGHATSSTFTANGTLGGPYTVTAALAGDPTMANFSLTNRVAGNTYVFYLSGQDPSVYFYALVGSVQIDPSGNVLAGEQDYNDGLGVLSPQPSGDTITGGTMSVSATTGQGTLTLITNNANLGVNGVETLAVQFVNTNHALITEFDGVSTSSGGLDTQTNGAPTAGYAFTLSGVDPSNGTVAFGGVFNISGSSLANGTVDENDNGFLSTGQALSGTISTFDSFGRGTISTSLNYSGAPIALNYYLVGPEVIRIVGVDTNDALIGSAYGQGVNAASASNASLGHSIFGMSGSPYFVNYATAGMFVPSSSDGTFSGVADDNEYVNTTQSPETSISGTYSIGANGYGNLNLVPFILGNVSVLGMYVTDPNLNLNDPNNKTSGLGGALLLELDSALAGGIGVAIPQTDTSTGSFTGNYAFGAQSWFTGLEYDFVGQGEITSGVLSGTGLLSDPFRTLNSSSSTDSDVTFAGTPLPDSVNVGRYSMFSSNPVPNPLNMTVDSVLTPLNVAIYQGSGGELFWIDDDAFSVFLGTLQQQGSLKGIPGSGTGSETIAATSGTPQSAALNTAFANPLVATVTSNGTPATGVVVTFTAPSSGASGTFAGGTNITTATTKASGVATSPVFTANGIAGGYSVSATVAGVSTPANFSLTNTSGALEIITATSGTPQSTVITTNFAAPLIATVTTGGLPTSGVLVTFTAPLSGASGTFGGSNTAIVITDSNGRATAPTFTANNTTGTYAVAATAAGASTAANFTLTNNPVTEFITAVSGTPQSATVNTAFAAPLVANVTNNGSPLSGVLVTFTAPAGGASGTFAGGTNVGTATTDAAGNATSPVFTANGTTGSYSVSASASGVVTAATFSLTNTAAIELITAISGTPQNATVNTAFAAPLVAKVTIGGVVASGIQVTFTAPLVGASGTFSGATNIVAVITDSNGLATSPTFTANATTGAYTVTATAVGGQGPANFSLTNTASLSQTIASTSGTPQSALINTVFAAPLVATVTTGGTGTSGVVVTFTAPASGASGTFAGATNVATASTDSNGVATSPTFTANGTAGLYQVTATTATATNTADFNLNNKLASATYVFYLSGQEEFGPGYYALAGSVEIDTNGNVVGGIQDYNDGGFGYASLEPSGDLISGGKLSVSGTTGQGTLTLVTNNSSLGVNGTETLGVQFVNSNHAMIIEFDGVSTSNTLSSSSGGMDLQTLPDALSGGFAFTMTGVDNGSSPVAFGGVFGINGATLENGSADENDNGTVTLAAPLSGTVTPFDTYGRGTITTTLNYGGTPIALNYYVVTPEVIRIIDVDSLDSAIGSAFGQGVNASSASNTSLGSSVFGLNGSPYPTNYAAVGMFATSNTSSSTADFSGVADDNELIAGYELSAVPISGTYSIASNGYGSMTETSLGLGDVSALGIYMTDPNLNLIDPNNTSSGKGGGLLLDLDSILAGGVGFVLPQTDTSTTSFTGTYTFGAQSYSQAFFEFDFVGQGSVTSLALTGSGLLSDPLVTLGEFNPTNTGVQFTGTAQVDALNPGRYTLFSTNTVPNPFKIKIPSTPATFLDVAIYQANGGQLLWLNEDPTNLTNLFFGSWQQLGSLNGIPATKPNNETQ